MIEIDDLDDQDPQFTYTSYTSMVKEGVSSVDLTIQPGDIYAEDLDTLNAVVAYSLSGKWNVRDQSMFIQGGADIVVMVEGVSS